MRMRDINYTDSLDSIPNRPQTFLSRGSKSCLHVRNNHPCANTITEVSHRDAHKYVSKPPCS